MCFFGKKLNYTQTTVGVIKGVSAVRINYMHLPLAEYVVDGCAYQVRVPYDIAVFMENQSQAEPMYVRANMNYGSSSYCGELTRIQGRQVQIVYDPAKPQKGKVVGPL